MPKPASVLVLPMDSCTVEAAHKAREVGDLGRAVQLDQTAPGGDDLDVVVLDLLPLGLHLEGPVSAIPAAHHVGLVLLVAGRGILGLEYHEHGLVVDVAELDLRLAHRLPEIEVTLADDVDELILLGEFLELLERRQDVAVRHGGRGGGEAVGVVHKERARLLVFLGRLGELELEAGSGDLILAIDGDGDLVREGVSPVD